jgi:hypothetical protein
MYVIGKLSTQNNAELLMLNSVRLEQGALVSETRYFFTLEQDPDRVA